jgi:hypothetical protein
MQNTDLVNDLANYFAIIYQDMDIEKHKMTAKTVIQKISTEIDKINSLD